MRTETVTTEDRLLSLGFIGHIKAVVYKPSGLSTSSTHQQWAVTKTLYMV